MENNYRQQYHFQSENLLCQLFRSRSAFVTDNLSAKSYKNEHFQLYLLPVYIMTIENTTAPWHAKDEKRQKKRRRRRQKSKSKNNDTATNNVVDSEKMPPKQWLQILGAVCRMSICFSDCFVFCILCVASCLGRNGVSKSKHRTEANVRATLVGRCLIVNVFGTFDSYSRSLFARFDCWERRRGEFTCLLLSCFNVRKECESPRVTCDKLFHRLTVLSCRFSGVSRLCGKHSTR